MNDLFAKYKESITLSYQYAFRLLLHLKNVISASQQIIPPGNELLKEVYRDSIVKNMKFLKISFGNCCLKFLRHPVWS